ncbi:MAG TPA: DUF2809 domain-containing protein [Daejeonella sp.]
MQFNINYFKLSFLLLAIEIFIAMYVQDAIIRPYVGDYLVVILLYCMIKSVLDADSLAVAIWVLLFSYTLEIMQYFKIVEIIGLESYPLANIIIGTSFEWIDLAAYTLGILTVLIAERRLFK